METSTFSYPFMLADVFSILHIEQSIATIDRAKESTVQAWASAALQLSASQA